MHLKDERMKNITQVLNGMKMLKLNAWENAFQQQIHSVRQCEQRVLLKQALLNALTTFLYGFAPYMISMVSFGTFVLVMENGCQLDARKAFVSLALFNILRLSIALLPIAIGNVVQSRVSLARIEKYLQADELDDDKAVIRCGRIASSGWFVRYL